MTQIKSLKDLQEMPKMARVLDSTYANIKETKSMIGGDFEIRNIGYSDKTVCLAIESGGIAYFFNFQDIQLLTPVEYNGRLIGIGDEIFGYGDWYEVFDYYWNDDKFFVKGASNKDYSDTYSFSSLSIEDIRPLYKAQTETIEIGGRKYNKKDFELAVKDLKEVK